MASKKASMSSAAAAPPVPRIDLSAKSIVANKRRLQKCWTAFSLLAGATAGTLGLQAINGILLYVCSAIIFSLLIAGISTGGNISKYFVTKREVFMGLTDHMLGYLLLWTMFYAFVYVY